MRTGIVTDAEDRMGQGGLAQKQSWMNERALQKGQRDCAPPATRTLSPETNQNGFVGRYKLERSHIPYTYDSFPVSDAFDVSHAPTKTYSARGMTAVSADDLSQ